MEEQQNGHPILEGAVTAQFFNLPTEVVITAIGSVVGVVLALLFAFFVLAPAGQRANDEQAAWFAKQDVCNNLGLDPVTGFPADDQGPANACYAALPPRP